MYVINNLLTFLQVVFLDEAVVFMKHYTYLQTIPSFLHIDLEMMRTLQSIIDNERIYEGHIQSDDFQQGDRRYITIPPMLIQSLFKRLEERDFSVSMRGIQVEHVSISTDEIPFSF